MTVVCTEHRNGKKMTYRTTKKGPHFDLIVEATREKVRQNSRVRDVLLSTGDLVLRPDHHQSPNVPAAWRYNAILMGIRRELIRRRRQPHPRTGNGSPDRTLRHTVAMRDKLRLAAFCAIKKPCDQKAPPKAWKVGDAVPSHCVRADGP